MHPSCYIPIFFVLTCLWYPMWTLTVSYDGTNVKFWTEDDWLETRFFINDKFMFNHEQHNRLLLRTRMDEWSLELSYGNDSRSNRFWTELHMYLDRSSSRTFLNRSEHISVKSFCRSPILSPLTNDSNVQVHELAEMDERIAKYFTNDGFFRTINYIHCTINERRRLPTFQLQMDIYLVTNREFQSLLYLQMPYETRKFLFDHHARFYLHNHQTNNFRYHFNMSSPVIDSFDDEAPLIRMIKLYNQPSPISTDARMIRAHAMTIFLILSFLRLSKNICETECFS